MYLGPSINSFNLKTIIHQVQYYSSYSIQFDEKKLPLYSVPVEFFLTGETNAC